MEDTASESGNTDDLISGVYPLDTISPLESPKLENTTPTKPTYSSDEQQQDNLAYYGSRTYKYQVRITSTHARLVCVVVTISNQCVSLMWC